MSGLGAVGEQLEDARQVLRQRWIETRQVWQDAAAEQFETTVIDPLERQARDVQERVAALAELVAAAEREVS